MSRVGCSVSSLLAIADITLDFAEAIPLIFGNVVRRTRLLAPQKVTDLVISCSVRIQHRRSWSDVLLRHVCLLVPPELQPSELIT